MSEPFADRPTAVHARIVAAIDAGAPFVVATVLAAHGSTPRSTGTKAIIDGTGAIAGTLGGGVVEATAQRRAVAACRSGQPVVFDADLRGTCADTGESICGGSLRLLLDPTARVARAAYSAAADAVGQRNRGVLVTALASADPVSVAVEWIPADQLSVDGIAAATDPQVGVAARTALAEESCQRILTAAAAETLVEPVIPEPRLLVVGAGHVGQALAVRAFELGFAVTVTDDRPEYAHPSRFPPEVAIRCGDVAGEIAAFEVDADTYVAIATRGHARDAQALGACVGSAARYIGMIGSRRKVALVREELLASGRATSAEFDRVYAPIGLDIGATTVPEIATSIAAQLVAVRRQRVESDREVSSP